MGLCKARGPHAPHRAEVGGWRHNANVLEENTWKVVGDRADHILASQRMTVHVVGGIQNPSNLIDCYCYCDRRPPVLALSGRSVDPVCSKPGVNKINGVRMRRNEGFYVFL